MFGAAVVYHNFILSFAKENSYPAVSYFFDFKRELIYMYTLLGAEPL